MVDYKSVVQEYREKTIQGKCLNFIPLKKDMLDKVVALRNQERSLYFFNQSYKLTLQDQEKWFEAYLERDDDIYWGIVDKNGDMVGTVRLYDITTYSCDHGSFVIDENKSTGAPYALEAMLLSLRFAFDNLKVSKVICDDRVDNKMMNSITKKVGFKYVKDIDIRGVNYHHYELIEQDFKQEMLETLLERWVSR